METLVDDSGHIDGCQIFHMKGFTYTLVYSNLHQSTEDKTVPSAVPTV
jgi:Cft2 family RNA processing exonuclease